MSSRLEKLRQDRHLRNSARALVEADIRNLREDLDRKSLTNRAIDRIAEGASDVYEEAIDVASDNKGALVAILAALGLWFARNPLFDILAGKDDGTEPDDP